MFQSVSIMILAGLSGLAIRYFAGGTALGLLAVNVSGSFIAGYLGGLKVTSSAWGPVIVAGLVGFCGCLTTFSGYALENVRLFEQGEIFKVASNFFLHNALCLFVCYAGYLIAQKL